MISHHGKREVTTAFDGHEEPDALVVAALTVLAEPLARFVKKTEASLNPDWRSKWDGVLEDYQETHQNHPLSYRDPRAVLRLLTDLDICRAFEQALQHPQGNVAVFCWKREDRRAFLDSANEAFHGKGISGERALKVLQKLKEVAYSLRATAEWALIDKAAATLRERINVAKAHRKPPTLAPADEQLACAGVHWVQPKNFIPGAWWVVTLKDESVAVVPREFASNEEVVDHFRETDGPVLAGFAFCFSAPRSFLQEPGRQSMVEMWNWARAHPPTSAHLPDPFLRCTPTDELRGPEAIGADQLFRSTEREIFESLGIRPASIFDLGGEGSVGALALSGMPLLADLQRELEARIWPLDRPKSGTKLTCVEIFPRALWSSIYPAESPGSKKNIMRRANFVADLQDEGIEISPHDAARFMNDERAFDALVTAWALSRFGGGLGPHPGNAAALEGSIWLPSS